MLTDDSGLDAGIGATSGAGVSTGAGGVGIGRGTGVGRAPTDAAADGATTVLTGSLPIAA